ncbi:MAG: glycerate kinase, partial [Angustibacter sp.]
SYLAQGALASRPLLGRGLAGAPGSGAAGGLGFALYLLGARLLDPVDALAEISPIAGRADDGDLALLACARLDGQSLLGGPVAWWGRQATARGLPTVVLAAELSVGRRELSAAGISTAFACGPTGVGSGPGQVSAFLTELHRRAGRVARSWSAAR